MIYALIICFVLIIVICLLGIPAKWDKIKKFDSGCYTPGLAEIFFDDFIKLNEHHGIKINLVKIESTSWGICFYYTEERIEKTKSHQ